MEETVQKLFRYMEDGTLEVRKWITEVPYDAFNTMAEVCKENGRVGRGRSAAMDKEIGKTWSQVLEDVEARNVFIKSIMWRSTDFLRHVMGETEGRGAITFIYVCEHCKMFPVEDFL